MSSPAADEARTLSDHELGDAINEAYRALFNLRFQIGTRQVTNPMALRPARRLVARLRTIERERALAAARGAPLEPIMEAPAPIVSPQKQRALEERAAVEETRAAAAAEDPAEAEDTATEDVVTEDVATDKPAPADAERSD